MSQVIKFVKVVSALPGTLENNTIYFVKAGPEVLAYVTNDLGLVVAYPITVDMSSKADVVHEHAGEDITSGTVNAAYLPSGTTSATGIVQLSTSTNSTSTTLAATPSAIKAAYDLAAAAIPATQKGAASGVATLDTNGLVPVSQLPSYVDDVLEYANLAAFPATGETSKIYVAIDTGAIYRWSGSIYVSIGATGNATDAQLRDRATHTGTQAISTIADLQTTLDGKQKTITQSASAPVSPAVGDLWIDLS